MSRVCFALCAAALVAGSGGWAAETTDRATAPATSAPPPAADDIAFCKEVLILHHSHVGVALTRKL